MNSLEEVQGTSAAGRMKGAATGLVFLLASVPMPVQNTSSAEPSTIWPEYDVAVVGAATTVDESPQGYFSVFPALAQGQDPSSTQQPRSQLAELRRLTGFTWEQLARLFNVDRRSVHNWVSGRRMNRRNEEALKRIVGVMRQIDRGSSSVNRNLLLEPRNGVIPFDLLASGRYEDALMTIGLANRVRNAPPKLSTEAERQRLPEPMESRAGTLEDAAHPPAANSRAARSRRVPRDQRV